MTYFAPSRLRIEQDVVIRIIRALKGKGSLNVSVGQEIGPSEIIGNSTISAGFRTLNLAALLEVDPHEVEKHLVRTLGQRIYKGELLARKKGWFGDQRMVTAPTDGVLDFLNNKTGELKIAFMPKKVSLPAGVYGIVEKVDNERGQVIIRTEVTNIYGICGSGRLRDGVLHILSKKDDLIGKDALQLEYNEHILVGGSLFFKDTISSAISEGVGGIITGGINAEDYKGMASGHLAFPRKLDNDIGISIVVCEGFGSIPIGDDIFEILCQYEGKFVFIDGNNALIILPSFSSSSLIKVKNTKLSDLPNGLTEYVNRLKTESELKIGMKVRIVGNSYLGEQGTVLAIDKSITLLPSGIKANLATIETPRRKIQVPVANLEIIV